MAEGLLVLPDFNGNRSPLADPLARGVIHGLTLDSSFDSLARLYYAACVGIVLGTRHVLDAMDAAGYAIEVLHLTGGHAANAVLLRLYADATDRVVALSREPDSVLVGTGAAAATASGLHASLRAAVQAMAGPGREIAPSPHTRAHFATQYRRFLLMRDQRRALDEAG